MLPSEIDFPLLNMLICKTKTNKVVFIGFSKGNRIDSAVIIRDVDAVDDFIESYNNMWEKSIPIIDNMKIHYNNILMIGKKFFGDKTEEEINSVIRHYMGDIYAHMKKRVPIKRIPHLFFKVDDTSDILDTIEGVIKEEEAREEIE